MLIAPKPSRWIENAMTLERLRACTKACLSSRRTCFMKTDVKKQIHR